MKKAKSTTILISAIVIVIMVSGISIASSSPNLVTQIVLSGGDNRLVRETIQKRLTGILNSLDNVAQISDQFDEVGYASFVELLGATSFKCVSVLYEAKLLDLPGGGYEVRGVRVRVNMQNTKGNPDQFLVFTINSVFLVTGVRFAMEEHLYQKLMGDGDRLKDFSNRQKILHFIEIFRTAYNRKDLEFLQKAYRDDALIIVGRVLERSPNQGDMLNSSFLTKDQITFVKLSKAQYLSKLETVFQMNDFIKVDFDSLEVVRHDSIPEIYGVMLKQRWQSSKYSDVGFLFLMIDFKNEDQPLVHVRTWQPEKFPDGSVISLYDFNIIE